MKKSYRIDVVDCAHVQTSWRRPQKMAAGVKDASVNFMALKMFVEFEEGAEPEKVMKDVLKACRKVEPDCEIFM